MFRIAKTLQMLKKKLKVWNKNIFGNELQEVVGTNSMIDEDEIMAKQMFTMLLQSRKNSWLPSLELDAKGCSMNNDLFNLIPNMVDLADNNFLEVAPAEIFYKHCWDIVKYDVCQAGYNNNVITLIPKEQGADTLSKFRPICMGNFFFKIISKILANRLRVIAPKLILEEQGAFLKGRHISSNICMALELLNSFPKKSHGGHLLKRFRFTTKFVSWVKQILFSANILKMICILRELWVLLGVFFGCLPFKYLGVPIFLGAPKAKILRPLLQRIHNKLSGWKGKILICKPIDESGLGLRRLRDVNFSILMKLAWNFIFAKYFKEDASMRSSFQVSSVRPGLVKDVWIGNTSLASLSGLPLSALKNSNARVSHFISGNPQTWCFSMVNSTFLNEYLTSASGIDLPHAPIPDQRIWKHTISGCKSYWNALVWNKGIHPRVSFMSWKVANNVIAIDEKIRSIGISLVSCCSLCGNSMNTRDHLFVTCFFANNIWSRSRFGGILRDSLGVVLGFFSGPIPIGTNYLAELNAFIYGAEYVIKKGFTNVWIEFRICHMPASLITTGYVVDDNIGKFCFFSLLNCNVNHPLYLFKFF
ncbi:hypothetical protein AMTRI_Chr04g183350 [Amborella trichopoda]